MTKLATIDWQALDYVRNTNGGATVADFVEDFEPVGQWLWDRLESRGLVVVDALGRIRLGEQPKESLP